MQTVKLTSTLQETLPEGQVKGTHYNDKHECLQSATEQVEVVRTIGKATNLRVKESFSSKSVTSSSIRRILGTRLLLEWACFFFRLIISQ